MSTLSFNSWTNLDGSENYKCRAWVNFNGTGVVAIRASGNVTSITDNGVGDYTINFTTPMPDANYAFSHQADDQTSGFGFASGSITTAPTISALRVSTYNAATPTPSLVDRNSVKIVVFR